MRQVIVFRW